MKREAVVDRHKDICSTIELRVAQRFEVFRRDRQRQEQRLIATIEANDSQVREQLATVSDLRTKSMAALENSLEVGRS